MYNLKLNNYHTKPKNSTIYTPPGLSNFLFNLLQDKVEPGIVLDPCCGQGSLLSPWKKEGYETLGIDIDPQSQADLQGDFFNVVNLQYWINCGLLKTPSLILCNPPFNGAKPKLAPEVWLDKILELFGQDVPIVLFVPSGFTLNLTLTSKRYQKFTQGFYPPIVSRITLPKNIFEGVTFHTEILIFNIQGLQPHYFFKP